MQVSIDILVATMFRTDLKFLEKMMSKNDIEDFNFIIVNQTSNDKLLCSSEKNIKIVNSLERGSPLSRNTAINIAEGDICLMADDDIVYLAGLKNKILKAYKDNPEADFISFEAINDEDESYTNYPAKGSHTKKSLKKIYTWVISFKRDSFRRANILFNLHFGVGSTFPGETEYVFLRSAFQNNLNMIHAPKTIVMHPTISSGMRMGSDDAFLAKTALQFRYRGKMVYIWLLKYACFMWKDGYININEIPRKISIGLNGIKKYKELRDEGEIE